MEWSEIREFADTPLEVGFTGTVRIEVRGATSDIPIEVLALAAVEAEIESFCAQVCRDFAGARRLFGDRTAPTSRSEQLLPWLPLRIGPQDPFAYYIREARLAPRLVLSRPLAGQAIAESIDVAGFQPSAYQSIAARPFLFSIEAVALEDGSLVAKIKGVIKFGAAALTLALAAFATPYGQQHYTEYQFTQQIERTVQGQQCQAQSTWRIDLSSLRQLALHDLNYAERGISDQVHALRVCNVQLAVALSQGSPALIDGLPGQQTRAALALYAASKGLSANTSIADARLRGLLLDELQHWRR